MYAIDKDFLPQTEEEYLLVLQNVMILKDYQLFIRQNLFEMQKRVKVVKPLDVFAYVLKIYYNNHQLKNTIRMKNAYNLYLRNWEKQLKLQITTHFPESDILTKLKRVGKILKVMESRQN